MLRLYFPATLLMQYTSALSVHELRELGENDPIKVYLDFANNTECDKYTSVLMLPNMRERFREYRNSLYGLVLGKDVELFFSKDFPQIIEWDISDLELSLKNVNALANLKLRRHGVIERMIVTDLTFRLYYTMHPRISDVIGEYREVKKHVLNMTTRQSSRYATIEKTYTPFDRHSGASAINITYPEQLGGFISSCFPLMSLSGVVQLGMLHFFSSGRWIEVNEALEKAGSRRRITKPSEAFLSDCEVHFEVCVDRYVNVVKRFVNDVKSILDEEDPVEKFILSTVPATFFDIYERAKSLGYDVDEVLFKLKDLIRRGKVRADGEWIK